MARFAPTLFGVAKDGLKKRSRPNGMCLPKRIVQLPSFRFPLCPRFTAKSGTRCLTGCLPPTRNRDALFALTLGNFTSLFSAATVSLPRMTCSLVLLAIPRLFDGGDLFSWYLRMEGYTGAHGHSPGSRTYRSQHSATSSSVRGASSGLRQVVVVPPASTTTSPG